MLFDNRLNKLQWIGLLSIAILSSGLIKIPAAVADIYRSADDSIEIPTRRASSITRCGCHGGGLGQVILLVPENGISTTLDAYPSFYWYTPTLGENRIDFRLQEVDIATDTWETIFTSTLRVSGPPSIHTFTLPSSTQMPPLEVGKTYFWSVGFACNPNQCHSDLMAEGWLRRLDIPLDLQNQLATVSPSESITLAAENGLWLEALQTLSQLIQENPDDETLQRRWQELLTSVGLDMLVEAEIAP